MKLLSTLISGAVVDEKDLYTGLIASSDPAINQDEFGLGGTLSDVKEHGQSKNGLTVDAIKKTVTVNDPQKLYTWTTKFKSKNDTKSSNRYALGLALVYNHFVTHHETDATLFKNVAEELRNLLNTQYGIRITDKGKLIQAIEKIQSGSVRRQTANAEELKRAAENFKKEQKETERHKRLAEEKDRTLNTTATELSTTKEKLETARLKAILAEAKVQRDLDLKRIQSRNSDTARIKQTAMVNLTATTETEFEKTSRAAEATRLANFVPRFVLPTTAAANVVSTVPEAPTDVPTKITPPERKTQPAPTLTPPPAAASIGIGLTPPPSGATDLVGDKRKAANGKGKGADDTLLRQSDNSGNHDESDDDADDDDENTFDALSERVKHFLTVDMKATNASNDVFARAAAQRTVFEHKVKGVALNDTATALSVDQIFTLKELTELFNYMKTVQDGNDNESTVFDDVRTEKHTWYYWSNKGNTDTWKVMMTEVQKAILKALRAEKRPAANAAAPAPNNNGAAAVPAAVVATKTELTAKEYGDYAEIFNHHAGRTPTCWCLFGNPKNVTAADFARDFAQAPKLRAASITRSNNGSDA